MRLDGARSATKKEQEGVTCATCGTIDFQARFSLRMVMGGVVFPGPSLQSALVRRTCQRSVGSRLLRNRRPYAAKCRADFRASRATPSPPIPQLRLVQGRRNAAQWASRRI